MECWSFYSCARLWLKYHSMGCPGVFLHLTTSPFDIVGYNVKHKIRTTYLLVCTESDTVDQLPLYINDLQYKYITCCNVHIIMLNFKQIHSMLLICLCVKWPTQDIKRFEQCLILAWLSLWGNLKYLASNQRGW